MFERDPARSANACLYYSYRRCQVFDADLDAWDTSSVEDMEGFENLDPEVKTRVRELIEGASPQSPREYLSGHERQGRSRVQQADTEARTRSGRRLGRGQVGGASPPW